MAMEASPWADLSYLGDHADPRIAFWRDSRSWPMDARGYVFAARAVLWVGRQAYGEAWSDASPATALFWPVPATLTTDLSNADVERGVGLLMARDTAYKRDNGTGMNALMRRPMPTQEQWGEAAGISKALSDDRWNRFLPYLNVCEFLAKAALDGKLKTATRKLEGGGFFERDWAFWNSERAWRWFRLCTVPVEHPFTANSDEEPQEWLYVEEASLRSLFAEAAKTEPIVPVADPDQARQNESRGSNGRAGGRKPNKAWDAIMAEFVRRLHNEGMPENESRFAEELYRWAAEQFDDPPSEKTIREKIRPLIRAAREG